MLITCPGSECIGPSQWLHHDYPDFTDEEAEAQRRRNTFQLTLLRCDQCQKPNSLWSFRAHALNHYIQLHLLLKIKIIRLFITGVHNPQHFFLSFFLSFFTQHSLIPLTLWRQMFREANVLADNHCRSFRHCATVWENSCLDADSRTVKISCKSCYLFHPKWKFGFWASKEEIIFIQFLYYILKLKISMKTSAKFSS